MNSREQAQFDMIKRVVLFGTNNIGEITSPVAPKKTLSAGQTQAKQIFDDLSTDETGLLAQIGKTAQSQQSGTGAARGGTSAKAMLRDELLSGLRGLNRTAAAIAEANGTPDVRKKFLMPYGVSDITLAAQANAMADAAEEMSDEFINYHHAESFADDLRALVTAFGEADDTQGSAQQTQVGATATFGPLLRQAMTKVKQLDAFTQNFYKANPTKLGEWETASHVQRAPKRNKTAAQAASATASVQAAPASATSATSAASNGQTANGQHATARTGTGRPRRSVRIGWSGRCRISRLLVLRAKGGTSVPPFCFFARSAGECGGGVAPRVASGARFEAHARRPVVSCFSGSAASVPLSKGDEKVYLCSAGAASRVRARGHGGGAKEERGGAPRHCHRRGHTDCGHHHRGQANQDLRG